MAPIDWNSLKERLEAEAARLAGELRREAERLAAQAQDPAVQARLREGAREVGHQALQALEQAASAAQVALAQAQEALRDQPPRSATPGDATPAVTVEVQAEPGADGVRKTVGRGAEAASAKPPGPPGKKTVGPKNNRSPG